MSPRRPRTKPDRLPGAMSEVQRYRELREKSYRERALKMFPHVCARCGREFEGRRLKELTVHHKDHNHENNPLDGSNWELLCIYCHDMEHAKYLDEELYEEDAPSGPQGSSSTYRPFAGLDDLLKNKT